MVNLQTFLRKLHPAFDDCPNPCALTVDEDRPRDLRDYCQTCEVRQQLDFYEGAAKAELARRFEPGECAWTFAELDHGVTQVMGVAARQRRGYPRGCSAIEARCLDTVRREQQRPARIADWEASQKVHRDG